MSQRKRIITDENSQLPRTPARLKRCSSSFVNTFGTPLTNTPLQTPSRTNSFEFVDAFTPVPKRRKFRRQVPSGETPDAGLGHDEGEVEKRDEEERKAAAAQEKKQVEALEKKEEERLNKALRLIEGVGYPTLHTFLKSLLTTKDQHRSSQVSRMLVQHGSSLLDNIHQRQPEVANDWAISTVRQLVLLAKLRHLASPRLATWRSPGGDQKFLERGGETWRSTPPTQVIFGLSNVLGSQFSV